MPESTTPSPPTRLGYLLLAILLILLMFGLLLSAAGAQSPTFDEGFYLLRGWAFFRTGELITLGHPPLGQFLTGAGVMLEPGLPDPITLDGWETGISEPIAQDFMWGHGINVTRVTFLGRYPVMLLTLLLGVFVYRWAKDEYGPWAGLMALMLTALSPNVLANGRLATMDMTLTVFFVATLYAWTRFIARRSWRWLVIGGVLFGLAQASKFSALILIPIIGIMALWTSLRRSPLTVDHGPDRVVTAFKKLAALPGGRLWTGLAAPFVLGVIGIGALWAGHLFIFRPYPLADYVSELTRFFVLAERGHWGYLAGMFSQEGWWYYHPAAYIIKTPVPTLILLLAASISALDRGMKPREWIPVMAFVIYLGISMTTSLNVGVRYLLPVIPLVFVYVARLASQPSRTGILRPALVGVMLAINLVIILWIAPYFLPFINLGFGGPQAGARWLADSNLDWGQDLPGLAVYMQENQVDEVYLSYFGKADPAYYGINYRPLPGWPPPWPEPEFHPMNPEPGIYAISASNLIGVLLDDYDAFGYFRAREPVAQIGYSIYIYEVSAAQLPSTGQSSPWFAQCSVPAVVENQPAIAARTGIEGLTDVYFDCTSSLYRRSGPGWILLPGREEPIVDIGPADYLARNRDGSLKYRAWIAESPITPPPSTLISPDAPLPISFSGALELLGYAFDTAQVAPGQSVTVTVWWRVRQPPGELVSVFAHLIAPDGFVPLTADALGVPVEAWQPGMVIVQQHTFDLPEGLVPGDYQIAVGLYNLTTGDRYPINPTQDQAVLGTVLVE